MNRLRSSLLLCAVAALTGCMSYKTPRHQTLQDAPSDWNPLPYHVAIVPTDASEVTPTGEGADGSGAPFEFEFRDVPHSGQDHVTTSLEAVLRANAFRKVTVLTPPSPAEYAALGDDLMATYWVTAAREANADLLLDVDSFSHSVRPTSRAEPLSFLLYLFGPIELLFPDREYSFDQVNLAVSLYEVAALEAPNYRSCRQLVDAVDRNDEGSDAAREALDRGRLFRLGAGAGTLRQFRVSPDDLQYRFGDRLGRGPGSVAFWPSILIPSALLQKNSEQFSERLTEDAALALGHDLAREIVEGDYEYIVQPTRAGDGLQLDARHATLRSSERFEGVLELHARIRKPASSLDRPQVWVAGSRYAVEIDGRARSSVTAQEVDSAFSGSTALAFTNPISGPVDEYDHDLVVYLPDPTVARTRVIPTSLSPSAPLDVVQLRLGENLGARGTRTRSWTFALEEALDAGAIEALQDQVLPVEGPPRDAASGASSEPVAVTTEGN